MRFIAVLLLAVSRLASAGDSDVKSLYDAGDHVLEVDAATFNESIYGQPTAFMVEFYSSWCGACIAYAPKWKQFAR